MARAFFIQLTRSAQKDLDRLPAKDRTAVIKHLAIFQSDPLRSPKVKKLKAKGIGQWRLEVWPYRVRYDILNGAIVIYRIRHRKEVYRA